MTNRYWEDYTDRIQEPLLDALAQNRLVAFLGAGLSRRCFSKTRAPLPDWSTLLNDLLKWGTSNHQIDPKTGLELSELLARGKLLMVAQECRDLLGDKRIGDFIAEVFDPYGVVPARVHELLAAIPFRAYITTNYDNLLERAHMQVHNRQLRIILPDTAADVLEDSQRARPLLKLHGDLDDPTSIVLGHRDYLRLMWTPEYVTTIRSLLADSTLLFVGYGLSDIDILMPLDQLAHEGREFTHYLLGRRGDRNSVEKKRLRLDRHIEVIEYTDHFGLHNHVDTFLEGLLIASGNQEAFLHIRPTLRARIRVHYSPEDEADGLFVWHYLFREGAITLSEEPQRSQWTDLKASISTGLRPLDHLVFVVTERSLDTADTHETIVAAIEAAKANNVLVIFLAVGFRGRPTLLAEAASTSPVFFLNAAFSESDLEPFRRYLSEDLKGGFRQR